MKKTLHEIFRRHGVTIGVGLAALVAFSWHVIGSFSDFYNCQECVSAEWIKFFFWKNFAFCRLPHFAQWHTDYMLYPYGVDSTFLFWSFEGNALQWLSRMLTGRFFPDQCYYVLSLAITYVGTYFLVGSRKGRFWGVVFAFVLTFCLFRIMGHGRRNEKRRTGQLSAA